MAGVWVGYDQPRPIRANGYASALAVPLWTQFMKTATRGDAPRWLGRPPGVDADERLRGAVVAERHARPQRKRGFSRLFGLGDERRRDDDRRSGIVIRDDHDREDRQEKKKEKLTRNVLNRPPRFFSIGWYRWRWAGG